jgi:hypothetical protein
MPGGPQLRLAPPGGAKTDRQSAPCSKEMSAGPPGGPSCGKTPAGATSSSVSYCASNGCARGHDCDRRNWGLAGDWGGICWGEPSARLTNTGVEAWGRSLLAPGDRRPGLGFCLGEVRGRGAGVRARGEA